MRKSFRASLRATEVEVFLFWTAAALAMCVAIAMLAAWRWPLVGDSSLIRYVVFLIHAGMRPYSQIIDINLPGSYFVEYVAMAAFGWGAHGLRLYDGFLCGCLCLFGYRMGENRRGRLAGLIAGLLTSLIHLHDGLGQGGQRDFLLAVMAVAAVSLLTGRRNRSSLGTLLLYEFLIGTSLTVKPTLALLALLPLADTAQFRGRTARMLWSSLGCGLAGLLAPAAIAACWLRHEGCLGAFLSLLGSMGHLHGELGRKPLFFLLNHSMSPVAILYACWLVVLLLVRPRFDLVRRMLVYAALCGLFSYLVQGKGYPYQRYPFLAFSLVLIIFDLAVAAERSDDYRLVPIAIVLCCGFVAGPVLARGVLSFDHSAPFQESLSEELNGLTQNGYESVQCFDTFGGCINTLYNLRKVQATGFLYDCYLFGPPGRYRDIYRADFLSALEGAKPDVLVVTDQFCFNGQRSFDRIGDWAALSDEIHGKYVLDSAWSPAKEYRFWSRAESPTAFRIYIRK